MANELDPFREAVEKALTDEAVYRGILGKKRLSDLLPQGVSLKDVIPRLTVLVASPFRERVEKLEERQKVSAAERRVLARKADSAPDVIILDDLTVAEVHEIVRLRDEGLSVARIAALFELPPNTVKHILADMAGKGEARVVYSAEMRRRRKLTLSRPKATGRRAIDIDVLEEGEAHPEVPLQR